MSEPLATEAVCLRTRNWRNSSCILALFTREMGLVSAIAKGARRPKNRLGAAANLFAHTRVLLHPPRSGELYLVTDAELLTLYTKMGINYEQLLAFSQLAEFLVQTLPPRQPEKQIFQLLLTYLNELGQPAVGQNQTILRTLILSFLLKALTFLGYRPELNLCAHCHKELGAQASFHPRLGALVCSACSSGIGSSALLVNSDQLNLLKKLLHTPAARLSEPLANDPGLNQAIARMVLYLIKHHYPAPKFPLLDRLAQPQE